MSIITMWVFLKVLYTCSQNNRNMEGGKKKEKLQSCMLSWGWNWIAKLNEKVICFFVCMIF